MRAHFYLKASGMFTGQSFQGPDDAVDFNTPDGCVAFVGDVDWMSQCVDVATGKLIDYQPAQPSPDHEWKADAKRWQLTDAVRAKNAASAAALARIAQLESAQHRAVREFLLGAGDAALNRLRDIDSQITDLRKNL